jgi:hypothetical protein
MEPEETAGGIAYLIKSVRPVIGRVGAVASGIIGLLLALEKVSGEIITTLGAFCSSWVSWRRPWWSGDARPGTLGARAYCSGRSGRHRRVDRLVYGSCRKRLPAFGAGRPAEQRIRFAGAGRYQWRHAVADDCRRAVCHKDLRVGDPGVWTDRRRQGPQQDGIRCAGDKKLHRSRPGLLSRSGSGCH